VAPAQTQSDSTGPVPVISAPSSIHPRRHARRRADFFRFAPVRRVRAQSFDKAPFRP